MKVLRKLSALKLRQRIVLLLYVPAIAIWVILGHIWGFNAGTFTGLGWVLYCFVGLWFWAECDLPEHQLYKCMLLWPIVRSQGGS